MIFYPVFLLNMLCVGNVLYAAADKKCFDYAVSRFPSCSVEARRDPKMGTFLFELPGESFYPSGSSDLASRHRVVVEGKKLTKGELFLSHRSGLVEATIVQVPRGFREGDGVSVEASVLLGHKLSCEPHMMQRPEHETVSVDIDSQEHETYLLLAPADADARRELRARLGDVFAMPGEKFTGLFYEDLYASCQDGILKKALIRTVTLRAFEKEERGTRLNESLLRSCVLMRLYERVEKVTFSAGQLYHPTIGEISMPAVDGVDSDCSYEPYQEINVCPLS